MKKVIQVGKRFGGKMKIENVTIIHEKEADPAEKLKELEALERKLDAEMKRLDARKKRMIDRR